LRPYFCAQDKIDVSGTTFTAVFIVVYAFAFLMNLLTSGRAETVVADEVSVLSFFSGGWIERIGWLFDRTVPRVSFWT
jgi:hypothetical protein